MEIHQEDIFQILKEIGLKEEEISTFLHILDSKDYEGAILYLRCRRCHLVDLMHTYQKKVDQLDFLLFQLKKSAQEEK